ncbi:hypothetical protein V499_04009 [Pseudogymnoascus sp. VKM F-103]|uniref:non-specific serine/threonine protein kinase n=1 Tax=Pseudogymnoascus verrucosus TaxID=342668 RepID=A0A2P2SX98_9PEZI|nr:uncharacterized protein VE01_00030 [Pseudogymnoascus verrucosus]KFY76301.1 hypothetical protein V499_04009 [Pseudogymnoascus sp. VKM F-103]OBU01489.1 hypothetical protein VE01_00030 [Pseudogymnoascus verrucosus]
MSSAVSLQAPHQSTTITSLPQAPSPSTRQYSSQAPQPRDQAYNQQTGNASPASTTRRPSKRPSGNGASPVTQQQPQQYYSPTTSAFPMTGQQHQSPVVSESANSRSNVTAAEYQRGMPPVAPPRTSSNQRSSGPALAAAAAAATTSTDRPKRNAQQADDRAIHAARVAAAGDGAHPDQRESRQTNGHRSKAADDSALATDSPSRSRRRTQQPGEDSPHRSNTTRESRSSQQPQPQSRQQDMGNSANDANGPIRETNDVLSRLVISQPEVDLDRERERMAEAVPRAYTGEASSPVAAPNAVDNDGNDDGRAGERRRQDHSTKREKTTKFGEYFLGNTLGEGEFGKVKMGWKQEGGVQVAIKLIRRDSVGTNPTRLAKIYREIAILREISHPNIVRLHEMVETEKHIGIILEYASGGELFDYILNHRYLKDNAARRLFAQLVSGVGYLHKKGIVHRDLKLENLLLDRNRNIIITDFGFANTFNPVDELGEEVEYGLSSRDYVRRMELDRILPGGFRRGDLMQTSCGSPCYAAPELVVSDSLYTGRKVDVWSCGVILYAMLAGYLPFDDDPANPEGDNINLLYKYIVSTPLTFPEYVTPHARDLLRRILVPDPRKRADLFEVARHSWLSEYAHVVGFITSNTTSPADIANTTVKEERSDGGPLLARSASVREPTKSQKPAPAVGDLARKHGNVDQDAEDHTTPKANKDAKRRTLQVEYVAPRQQTVRGEDISSAPQPVSRTRAGGDGQGHVEGGQEKRRVASSEKPLPLAPGSARDSKKPPSSHRSQPMAAPSRPGREPARSTSENAFMAPLLGQGIARPNTGGSMTSTQSGINTTHYSQTAAPTVATTNAHGRMSQPTTSNGQRYDVSPEGESDYGRPSISQGIPPKFARLSGMEDSAADAPPTRSHKRSSTIGSIFGRHGSIFGGKTNAEKPKKSYPPVSYPGPAAAGGEVSRQSVDSSRRSISFGFGKKRSGSVTGSTGGDSDQKKSTRRFSLLPANFSLKSIGIGKDSDSATPSEDGRYYDDGVDRSAAYGEPTPPVEKPQSRPQTNPVAPTYTRSRDGSQQAAKAPPIATPIHQRYASATQQPPPSTAYDGQSDFGPRPTYRPKTIDTPPPTEPAHSSYPNLAKSQTRQAAQNARYNQNQGYNDYDSDRQAGKGGRGVLQKNNRKFTEAYEADGGQDQGGYGGNNHTSGSSGAARKVMDFFRRRGRAREGEM